MKYIVCMLIMLLIGMVSRAEAVIVDWASMVSDSNVSSAASALNSPDGIHASFTILQDCRYTPLILGLEKTIVAIILPLVLRLCLELVK